MRKRMIIAAVSATFAFAAAAGTATAQSRSGQDLTPTGRGAYVAVAGAHEVYEVRAAELALEKARDAAVRSYAQTMLDEHRQATGRLEAAARGAGLEGQLPLAMTPMHWDMVRRLERASGSRFDDVYADQQVEAHEMALELHRNFAANGEGPRLKAFAEAALPAATRHLEQARQLDP